MNFVVNDTKNYSFLDKIRKWSIKPLAFFNKDHVLNLVQIELQYLKTFSYTNYKAIHLTIETKYNLY